MIEVIAVLLVIGIVAAVVISRSTSTDSYSVVSEADILKSNLRFAQLKSMGSDSAVIWGITVAAGSYTLTCSTTDAVNDPCPTTLLLPGDNSATHTFASGITVTAGTGAITFDNWGSPIQGARTITLSGGSETATVAITANSGFIP